MERSREEANTEEAWRRRTLKGKTAFQREMIRMKKFIKIDIERTGDTYKMRQ